MAEMKKLPDGSLIMIGNKPKVPESKPGFLAGFKAAIGLSQAPPPPPPAPVVPSWMAPAPAAPAPGMPVNMPQYGEWMAIEQQNKIREAVAKAAPKISR